MRKKGLVVLFLAGLFFSMTASIFADIKDYVMVVTPLYDEKTRALFADLSKRYEKMGSDYDYWKNYFGILAEEHAFGTGWVFVDSDGENYIITNRHVIAQAQMVNVYFETPDGKRQDYKDCPILYVDSSMDLAICQFPGEQKLFETGFKIDDSTPKDMTQVVAAGFPGLGVTPVWQVSLGSITNAQARINPSYTSLIQHSAPIDPGNSGGPLLVKDDTDQEIGYKVIGVNTWQASGRQTTNFSIPARDVKAVLEKAKKARAMKGDADTMRAELTKNCKILASELSSEHPDRSKVFQYISYAFVGEKGAEAFDNWVRLNPDSKKDWQESFYSSDIENAGPINTMRAAIYYMFWTSLRARTPGGDLSTLEFKEINFSDSNDIASKTEVRTLFTLGPEGKKENHEISWIIEYGEWRVSNLELPVPAPVPSGNVKTGTGKGKKSPVLAYILDIGLGFGTGQFYVQAGNGVTFLLLDSATLTGAVVGSLASSKSGDTAALIGGACLLGYLGVRIWEFIDIFGKVQVARAKGIFAMTPYLDVKPQTVSMGVSFTLPLVRPSF
ncbi:MAG: trypsin-like peptidase domain-containing protein [Spirochaetia bacterium]|jgi:serine protease Do